MAKIKKLLLLTAATVGILSSSCAIANSEEGTAMVRYTWETGFQPAIQSIAASYNDVMRWYDYVYMASNGEDVSDMPISKFSGSRDIPNDIYVNTPPYDTRYKERYMQISAGNYTAVCTVDDILEGGFFYIVANYEIKTGENGSVRYYEIAFDVGKIINGKYDEGWNKGDYNNYDNPNTPPRLKKASAGRFVKKIETDGVTYYVLRGTE